MYCGFVICMRFFFLSTFVVDLVEFGFNPICNIYFIGRMILLLGLVEFGFNQICNISFIGRMILLLGLMFTMFMDILLIFVSKKRKSCYFAIRETFHGLKLDMSGKLHCIGMKFKYILRFCSLLSMAVGYLSMYGSFDRKWVILERLDVPSPSAFAYVQSTLFSVNLCYVAYRAVLLPVDYGLVYYMLNRIINEFKTQMKVFLSQQVSADKIENLRMNFEMCLDAVKEVDICFGLFTGIAIALAIGFLCTSVYMSARAYAALQNLSLAFILVLTFILLFYILLPHEG